MKAIAYLARRAIYRCIALLAMRNHALSVFPESSASQLGDLGAPPKFFTYPAGLMFLWRTTSMVRSDIMLDILSLSLYIYTSFPRSELLEPDPAGYLSVEKDWLRGM